VDSTTYQRFLAKVRQSSACWEWKAVKNRDGYGRIRVNGKMVLAHRLAYIHFIGEIPEGMVIMHTCNNPGCVNPVHLCVGTQAENIAHCIASGRRAKGERNGAAKLTTADVVYIRTAYGKFSQQELAEAKGVDPSMVSRIVRGKKWAHVA
jgi:HNH endonuclease